MRKQNVLDAMSALSTGVRLDVFRLLVRSGKEGMVSGDIAKALDIPLTNTSFHLKTLVQAKLANVEQQGRFQRYRANIPQMLDVIAYLTENCCADDPGACRPMRNAIPNLEKVLPDL
jgi:DNA-binding transcriptional ArsR family regulator